MHGNFQCARPLAHRDKVVRGDDGRDVRDTLAGMRIASLHTYPVKGCHRLDHDEAGVERWGLVGDRRWIVIDPDGVGITQRITARLALLSRRATGASSGWVTTFACCLRSVLTALPGRTAGPEDATA